MTKIPNLFQLLDAKGIKYKDFAAAIGASTGNVSDWKSGKAMPSSEKLVLISSYLGVSIDYLLGNEDIKNRPAAKSDEPRDILIAEILDNLKSLNGEQLEATKRVIDTIIAARPNHKPGK